MSGAALVTGALGFIGRYTARHLARRGWTVSGIGHGRCDDAQRDAWGLSAFSAADVTLPQLLANGGRPGLIVHCAGGSTVGYSVTHPLEDFERTVSTTSAVLEFARTEACGARVVFLSSAAVYGNAARQPLREDAPLAPLSPYGVHKRFGEDLCRQYASRFEVPVAVLRLFSVYGEGMRKQLLWEACQRTRAGSASFGGSGAEVRDWLHVEDAASLIERAHALASVECPVVNGGTGDGVSVATVLGELLAGLGCRDAPRFSGEARAGDPEALVADVSRACASGWHPEVRWQEGVRRYAAWFREAIA